MSIQDTNPSVFFGGTWERIAKGKTLVGVDESDSDFNASSKTGGEKKHTLTIDELPKHTHNIPTWQYYNQSPSGLKVAKTYNNADGGSGSETGITGNNQPHNNMQPFYTCYIFVRTA